MIRYRHTHRAAAVAAALLLSACSAPAPEPPAAPGAAMDAIAEEYVRLVLAVGEHDDDYVDAYYGIEAWREQIAAAPPPLEEIARRAAEQQRRIDAVDPATLDEASALRQRYLATQLGALAARVRLLQGETMSFDEESQALYDAVAPRHDEPHFQTLLAELDPLLAGDGPIADRYRAFRERFVIPDDRVDQTFRAAIDACRSVTAQHVELPPAETFQLEYVTGKSWSGYNHYQGGFHSLIEINRDLPIYIDRALDLACHEGYPGHHVYNALLERELVRNRGWIEFSVYPLFSPQSLIAEGTANYGVELAFPPDERLSFEKYKLFTLAGLDPDQAERYDRVRRLVEQLAYAGNEAARRYLDGEIDAGAAADWLQRYALMTPERAAQRVRFIDEYRSYVINYNLGQDLVRAYVEERAATPDERWDVFIELLSSPRLPSSLR